MVHYHYLLSTFNISLFWAHGALLKLSPLKKRHCILCFTICASRGSPPASCSVCWYQGLACVECYSAASFGSKVGLVLSPIMTQAPGSCLCLKYLIGLFSSPPYVFAQQFPQILLDRSDWLNFSIPPHMYLLEFVRSAVLSLSRSLQYISKVPYHQHVMYGTREREMSTLL
jgi:hypothetical protein